MSSTYHELRDYLDTVPVINSHEHHTGTTDPIEDALSFVASGYFLNDLISAADGLDDRVQHTLSNLVIPFEERYDLFSRLYARTRYTGYAQSALRGMQACWEMEDFSKESMQKLSSLLQTRDADKVEQWHQQFRLKSSIVNIFELGKFQQLLEGKLAHRPDCRFAFPLPEYHNLHRYTDIMRLQPHVPAPITSLDDYLTAFENLLHKALEFGIICLKDQSAYRRALDYKPVARHEVETIFMNILSHPRETFGSAEVRPLDDYLFHHFMRMAAKHHLPVQLHTGHMAGSYNDIRKTNAAHLLPLLELHKDVRFALFHANWPYMDDYLFIGKNYPNVVLDLCWAPIIDPESCITLLKRAVTSIPHSKIIVFGGDSFTTENTVGSLLLTRDVVARALSDLVDSSWITMEQSRHIAHDWFYTNPRTFYQLD